MLGAAGVQIGTAYLLTPESTMSPIHRAALKSAREDQTVLTNVFTGRPARGIVNRIVREVGPMSADAPAFPVATGATFPLRAKAEAKGSGEFSSLWSGQAPRFAREMPAGELTRELARSTLALLESDEGAVSYQERMIAVPDGLNVFVRDYPAVGAARGVPVICLHGLTRNSADFEVVAPRMAALGRRVLAFDVRGRGRSDRDPKPRAVCRRPSMRWMSCTRWACFGVDRAVFVGTSMGGLITMMSR